MYKISPKVLKNGDTIGLVAPSNPINVINDENIKLGLKKLNTLGFNVKFGKHIYSKNAVLSATAKERAADIMEMFCDNGINAIMAVLGGFNSNEVLEYLDYELIRKNPKIFIGYSDITALNISLLNMSGLINFSGPSFALFCQNDLPGYTLEHFKKAVMSVRPFSVKASERYVEDKWYIKNDKTRMWKPSFGYHIINGQDFSGECIGGNLQTLMALNGTKYFPDFKSKVLFLEESDNKSGAEIRRYIVQLRQMGVLEEINGLVIGRFCMNSGLNCENNNYYFEYMVKEILGEYRVPIVYNVDFGHTDPIITIPLGTVCKFFIEKQEFEFNTATSEF